MNKQTLFEVCPILGIKGWPVAIFFVNYVVLETTLDFFSIRIFALIARDTQYSYIYNS